VKIGVCSANSGPYATPARLRSVAELCEATGVESIWVSEHLVLSDPRTPPSPMDPEDPILDPVTSLAFLAGITSSVRLGTGVIVLPLRNPLVLAKALATVDVVSQGRLIVGLGAGYVEREFAAIGVPFTDRGTRFEEYLAAMRSIWTEPHPSFSGRYVAFDQVQAHPHPVQDPHPPIVLGGYAPAVLRRAIREADGWYGWGLDPGRTARYLASLREMEDQVGRGEGLGALEITVTPPDVVDPAGAAAFEELGVDRLNLMLPWSTDGDQIASFFERVVAPLVDDARTSPPVGPSAQTS
jgi:probable F420-dependent oxidoreductase